jgi:hypothetical protein
MAKVGCHQLHKLGELGLVQTRDCLIRHAAGRAVPRGTAAEHLRLRSVARAFALCRRILPPLSRASPGLEPAGSVIFLSLARRSLEVPLRRSRHGNRWRRPMRSVRQQSPRLCPPVPRDDSMRAQARSRRHRRTVQHE